MSITVGPQASSPNITDDNTYITPAEFEATYYRQEAIPAIVGSP